jgi:hypothetical protein
MHGPDDRDPRTLPHACTRALADLKIGVQGLRLAVLPEAELGDVAPEVASAFSAALDVMRGLGASIEELALPMRYKRLADLTGKIIAAEAYDLHRDWIDRDDLPFDADIRDRIRWERLSLGRRSSSESDRPGAPEAAARAGAGRFRCGSYPGYAHPGRGLGRRRPGQVSDESADEARQPARSVRARPAVAALPGAGCRSPCRLSGARSKKARILRIGWAFENATDWQPSAPADRLITGQQRLTSSCFIYPLGARLSIVLELDVRRLITLAHFARSVFISAASSSGVDENGIIPCLSRNSRVSGNATILASSVESLLMIAFGVPAGARARRTRDSPRGPAGRPQ